ncbi:MAG: Omp28-related outer membrane protein [Saprospiraceae bacterium]|nr:Omp28-related outer membrane protein [Saprospiraceae bacterium]
MFLSTAMVNAQVVLWSENFDASNSLPAGWTQSTLATDGGWKVGTTAALESDFFPIAPRSGNVIGTNDDACNCNKSNDLLKLPAIDLSTAVDPYLLFDLYYAGLTYQGATEKLTFLVSENGTDYTAVSDLAGTGAWTLNSLSLKNWVGKSAVYVAFRYNDAGGWLYGACFDNMRIVERDNIVRASLTTARTLRRLEIIPTSRVYSTFMADSTMRVGGVVANPSFEPITSFDASWTDGQDTFTQAFTGLNIAIGRTYAFEINTAPLTLKEGDNTVEVTISNVNGVGDNDPSDNTRSTSIEGVRPAAGRKVFFEEATGTWCVWCPRGAIMMDHMAAFFPKTAVLVAVHNADPMVVTEYDALVSASVGGYPSGIVDRAFEADPIEFEEAYAIRIAEEPAVLVSQDVAWDDATRTATVTSKLNFVEETNGNYRIAVFFTEDGVKGTATGYAQRNAYAGGAAGPMGGYENLPATVPASQMVYEHVARGVVGGANGVSGIAGSVPATNPAGSSHEYTSTFVVNANYNIDNMHAITVLINSTTGEVLNAEQTPIPFSSVSSSEPQSNLIQASIFPNPVAEYATLSLNLLESADVQVRIIDAMGRIAVERNYTGVQGEHYLPFQSAGLANGTYLLSVSANGQMITKPFVIQR